MSRSASSALAASLPEFGTDQHQHAQQTQFTHVIFSIAPGRAIGSGYAEYHAVHRIREISGTSPADDIGR